MDKLLFDTAGCTIDVLQDDLFTGKKVTVAILRLDKIHAIVSGNKLFKLHYFLEQAMQQSSSIITFGGAYSNHLLATAFACKTINRQCIGIVRGEKPPQLSSTLLQCIAYGMELVFISRTEYDNKENKEFIKKIKARYKDPVIIPEGGYHIKGAAGAGLIMDLVPAGQYTHIVTATGTATTTAGLLQKATIAQTIIAVPVLKGMADIKERIRYLNGITIDRPSLEIMDGYHFGGYAKYSPALITFMNDCWSRYALPLDFVYTAKMFAAIKDQVQQDHFLPDSSILCLHTGGLQGNNSLPANTLLY